MSGAAPLILDEAKLNRRMGDIADRNGVAAEVSRILVEGALRGEPFLTAPCRQVLRALEQEPVRLDPRFSSAYQRTAIERISRRFRHPDNRSALREYFDWLFDSERLALIVEVKIRDRPLVENDQLKRYARTLRLHPQFRHRPVKGILVLTAEKLSRWQLGLTRQLGGLPSTKDLLLGQLLWRDVADELRSVRLQSTADQNAWNGLIDFALGSPPPSSSSRESSLGA